jgi:hypothetical protein
MKWRMMHVGNKFIQSLQNKKKEVGLKKITENAKLLSRPVYVRVSAS